MYMVLTTKLLNLESFNRMTGVVFSFADLVLVTCLQQCFVKAKQFTNLPITMLNVHHIQLVA